MAVFWLDCVARYALLACMQCTDLAPWIQKWPVSAKCILSYRNDQGDWVTQPMALVNMIATSLHRLGTAHHITEGSIL